MRKFCARWWLMPSTVRDKMEFLAPPASSSLPDPPQDELEMKVTTYVYAHEQRTLIKDWLPVRNWEQSRELLLRARSEIDHTIHYGDRLFLKFVGQGALPETSKGTE